MTDAISGEMRALAGPELYRRNAFRISGLQATVDRRTTRQVLQRLKAALEVGADVDTAGSNDPHEIQAACDLILGDPRRRLVHEVFAKWGDDTTQCGCRKEVHRHHDLAVEAHATAIEQNEEPLWTAASQNWANVLADEDLWDHLVRRVDDLDDRQLDLYALDTIEGELPRTLLKPLTDRAAATTDPASLVKQARQWPAPEHLVTELLEQAAKPLYEELEERIRGLNDRLQTDRPDTIATEVQRHVVPALTRLDPLVEPSKHHRTAVLHDKAAILLNNCAVQLLDRGEVTDGRAGRWLAAAAKLAIDPREQDLVRQNQEALAQTVVFMGDFERQVLDVLNTQGKYAASTMLRQIRRSTDIPQVHNLIDVMLKEIADGTFKTRRRPGGRPPSYPPTHTPGHPYRRRRPARRALFWALVVAAAIVFALFRWGPLGHLADIGTANLWNHKIADNAKIGTCLGRQDGDWRAKPSGLKKADCDKPHWGEVLGYARLSERPGPYPGDDQTAALATFSCNELLAQQGLSPKQYVVEMTHSPADYWNTGKDESDETENYAPCIVRGADNQDLTAGSKVNGVGQTAPKAVPMELYGGPISANAPVGLCIQEAGKIPKGGTIGTVPVIRCEAVHWGEVIGYPVIFKPSDTWPGDDAVFAKAKAACQKLLPNKPGLDTTVGFPGHVWWSNPNQPIYTFCVAHYKDNKPYGGRLS